MSRVLVIDDDIELCELLGEYLTPEGFELETVNDGRRGSKWRCRATIRWWFWMLCCRR